MSGPFWIDDLHDEDFINTLLNNLSTRSIKYKSRIETVLKGIKDELQLKSEVFNYDYAKFSRDITLSSPKLGIFQ
jgi:tRNA G26 N,N-dimethylase Trm1